MCLDEDVGIDRDHEDPCSPSVRVLVPGARYPQIFAACLRAGDARGNLAFDAQIAAVCLEQGARELLTLDRDFARFPELTLAAL